MEQRTFVKIAGVIFLLVTLVHLWRIVQSVPLALGDTLVPMGASWVAVVLGAYLSFQGLRKR